MLVTGMEKWLVSVNCEVVNQILKPCISCSNENSPWSNLSNIV